MSAGSHAAEQGIQAVDKVFPAGRLRGVKVGLDNTVEVTKLVRGNDVRWRVTPGTNGKPPKVQLLG